MLKKGDLVLVGIIIAAVILSFSGLQLYKSLDKGNHKIAVVKQNDKVIDRIDLDKVKEPYKIEIKGDYTDVVLVEQGRIRFEEANCPDLVCVKTGWLTEKGDMAVCLPNRASIKIEGTNDVLDGTTY